MKTLDEAVLRQQLAGLSLGTDLHLLQTTGSTQDEAGRLVDGGAGPGTVVLALEQRRGRGRGGRAWIAPRGAGLWFTVVLEHARAEGPLPLVAGVAVAEALQEVAGPCVRLKWPNDVLLENRKVAGILAEVHRRRGASAVLLGIGINVNLERARLPEPWRDTAASLHEARGQPLPLEPVFGRVLRRLDAWLQGTRREGYGAALTRWRALSVTLGTRVRIGLPRETVEGLAVDIDESGALLVRSEGGAVHRVTVGDVEPVR